ncbi:hypothetical protein PR202_ga23953 [Eleusine coracana subsp. coracana]|uniref:Secreted protein n=1 Tax=Eleusine coracana subsp. coracana TaxID=191504 RepID=A0AAV5D766_ELECO|nr:hypothetical protein PR202_ga23953 [Eleusine coracana subsp. coracana]
MASIVLLLSELLGGESASVVAANRYMCGQSLGEFRPAVTGAPCRKKQNESAAGAGRACTGREEEKQQAKEESFEDLAVSRIAVDVMWP